MAKKCVWVCLGMTEAEGGKCKAPTRPTSCMSNRLNPNHNKFLSSALKSPDYWAALAFEPNARDNVQITEGQNLMCAGGVLSKEKPVKAPGQIWPPRPSLPHAPEHVFSASQPCKK